MPGEESAVLPSKLRAPSVSEKVLWRPRLSPLLAHAADSTAITLVVAPSGYGKTTLISSWLARSRQPAAWLSLDAEDSGLDRFMLYLSKAFEGLGVSPRREALQGATSEQVAVALLDELLLAIEKRGQGVLLVLDNYHLIDEDSPAHRMVSYTLSHLPSNLHVVILARRMPHLGLFRWRLEDKLVEITENDLAFTPDEIVGFFKKLHMALPDTKAQHIHEYTKGWPAAIKLLSLSTSSLQDLERPFEQNPEVLNAITDYLLEEVSDKFDEATWNFLLVISHIDLFCSSLAEELTGLNRATIARILDCLLAEKLFVKDGAKGDHEPWYQCSPLFSTALRRQALRNNGLPIADILKRASHWFEKNGNYNQAALYAQQIRDYRHIEQLIVVHWRSMYMEDNMFMLYRWGKMLPDEVLLANPQVCSVMSLPALLADDVALASLCEETAIAHFTDETVAFFPEAMAIHAQVCSLQKRYEEAQRTIDTALTYLPTSDYFLCALTKQCQLFTSVVPDWNQYRKTVLEDLPLTLAHGNKTLICNQYAYLAFSEACLGHFTSAFHYAEKALSVSGKASYPYRTTFMNIYFARMSAAYHRGNISEAELNQKMHCLIPKESFASHLLALSHAYKALFGFVRGDMPEAERCIASSIELSSYGLLMVAMPIQLLGHLVQARILDFDRFLEETSKSYGQFHIWNRMKYTYGFFKGDLSLVPGVRALAEEIDEAWSLDKIHALLLLALFEEKCGNKAEAEKALLKALDLAAPERITQLFYNDYDFILPILSRMPQISIPDSFIRNLFVRLSQLANGETSLGNQEGQVQLTPRESDVVCLLLAGYSAGEIAQRMEISKETVRKHIANVYTKFGVHSRTQLLLRLG